MKITYPECQIEISVDEVIALLERTSLHNAGARLVQEIETFKEQGQETEAPKAKPKAEKPKNKGGRPRKAKKLTPDEEAALDAVLKEIEESNKQPYEFGR